MSWFDRFRPRDEGVETTQVPLTTLTRWSLYDLGLENPNSLAEELGLTPVSQEGEEKELEDSSNRLNKINHLASYLDLVADINAQILSASHLVHLKEHGVIAQDVEEEDLEELGEFFKTISISALVIAFSSAMNLGMIQSNLAYGDYVDGDDYGQF